MKEKFKNLILSKRWFITIGTILLGIIVTCTLSFLASKNIFLSNDKLENINFAAQIVSALFVSTGVIIAGWQYVIATRAEMMSVNISQIQKAIDLSAFYKDNILKPYIAVNYVFESSGILEIIKTINVSDMTSFDMFELNRILPTAQQDQLKKLQNDDIFITSVMDANEIYGLNLQLQTKIISKEENSNIVNVTYDRNQIIGAFMSSIVTNMLNDMEFFAMHFSHKTADDSVVYQSLHQTYLEIVQTLYYNISRFNVPGQSLYYTNLIELYKKWFTQQQEQMQKIASGSRDSQYKGNSVPTTL